jgi:hypothetical protein
MPCPQGFKAFDIPGKRPHPIGETMSRYILTLVAFSLSSLASAATVTYKVDYESMSDIYPEILRECGAPESFKIDTEQGLELQIIGQLYPKGATHVWSMIPSTRTLTGVNRNPNYMGTFQHSIHNVHQNETGAEGEVQIDAFGALGSAATGLVITTSVNLEGNRVAGFKTVDCGELWYAKEK